ncbi:MAG: DUF4442 domain-containing protein [Bdellovibrionaceae bacterium]|nr:DUF4442 domain-containing protein [Pseudobdellovibrionaceae bacterium]
MQIPVLFFIRPKVLRVDEKGCTVVIPLNRRTKNHLGCMYFGVLACGADIAGGLVAMKAIDESGEKISLIFKDFQAQFLKRVEGDCHFVSDDADRVKALVQEAIQTGDRVETSVSVVAHVPGVLDEPAATFQLTLSLKKKS